MNEDLGQSQDAPLDGNYDRVFQIDSSLSEEAVQHYFREIDEVTAAIRSIDVSQIDLPVPFTPSWRDESRS